MLCVPAAFSASVAGGGGSTTSDVAVCSGGSMSAVGDPAEQADSGHRRDHQAVPADGPPGLLDVELLCAHSPLQSNATVTSE